MLLPFSTHATYVAVQLAASCPTLSRLDIHGCLGATVAAIGGLRGLSALRFAGLRHCTGEYLDAALADMPRLKSFRLSKVCWAVPVMWSFSRLPATAPPRSELHASCRQLVLATTLKCPAEGLQRGTQRGTLGQAEWDIVRLDHVQADTLISVH